MKDKFFSILCLFILIMGTAFADKNSTRYPSKGSGPMMDGHGPMVERGQQPRMYGWQLMTEEERLQHRERMHKAKSYEEQQQYILEHREEMLERAKKQGVELPELDDEYPYRYKK